MLDIVSFFLSRGCVGRRGVFNGELLCLGIVGKFVSKLPGSQMCQKITGTVNVILSKVRPGES